MALLTIDKTVDNKTNQERDNKIKKTKRLDKLEKRLGLISNKLGLSYAIYTK
jgi:hypothetical protein